VSMHQNTVTAAGRNPPSSSHAEAGPCRHSRLPTRVPVRDTMLGHVIFLLTATDTDDEVEPALTVDVCLRPRPALLPYVFEIGYRVWRDR
jgi:hypothetical protein